MIDRSILEGWRESVAPWRSLAMVEHDLILSRILIEIYKYPKIAENLAFRGGTALNKLFINPPARFSEDIDLVQIKSEPIGDTLDQLRAAIDPWLGKPKWKITRRSVKMLYQYQTWEDKVGKLKIEINTTEHFHLLDLQKQKFSMNSEWFSGEADLLVYQFEEMTATKFKALYQRRKGRDLFDTWMILDRNMIDVDKTIGLLEDYCNQVDEQITRALFERNMILKKDHPDFYFDMQSLLAIDTDWDFNKAFDMVMTELIPKLKGEAWKGEEEI
jgi:predicted nucleotidyltransferase component of viral defense system